MPDEIKIEATLDTTDVADGVARINSSLSGIKWEFAEAAGINPRAMADAGERAGDSFMGGFAGRLLKSMLLRDAIRGVLYTFQEAISNVMDSNARLSGGPPSKGFHPLKAFGDWIGGGLSIGEQLLAPGWKAANEGLAGANVGAINAASQREKQLQGFKEDPSRLGESTSDLETALNGVIDKRAEAARHNAIVQGTEPEANVAKESEESFKALDKQLAETERYFRELVSLGKERDRRQAEADKKAYGTGYSGSSPEKAEEFMRGEMRKDAVEAERKTAEAAKQAATKKHEAEVKAHHEAEEAARKKATLAKRTAEHGLTEEEHAIGKSQGGIDRDLDFTERQLGNQKATSAVRIGGGLYGRNDSAAQLVNHAAQQVSLLRSIDSKIEAIRNQHTEMTLA